MPGPREGPGPFPASESLAGDALAQGDWARVTEFCSETTLTAADLIWPVFVLEGENRVEDVKSMPGVRAVVTAAVAVANI